MTMSPKDMIGSLRRIASTLESQRRPSKAQTVAELRTLLAAADPTAGAGEDFQKENPKITDEEAAEIDKMHEKNKDVVKDKNAAFSGDPHWITAKYPGVTSDGTPFKRGDRVLYWPKTKTIMIGPKAEAEMRRFESELADEMQYNSGYHAACTDTAAEKDARFQTGQPADPTQNMSEEDAAEWKAMNEEYGDKFKTASKLTTHLEGKKGRTLCGEDSHEDTLVKSFRDATCYYCRLAWQKSHGGL